MANNVYILLQIFWMADNNKIDIVQYELGVAYIFYTKDCFRLPSHSHTLFSVQIGKQPNENMTCTHNDVNPLYSTRERDNRQADDGDSNGDNHNNEKKL